MDTLQTLNTSHTQHTPPIESVFEDFERDIRFVFNGFEILNENDCSRDKLNNLMSKIYNLRDDFTIFKDFFLISEKKEESDSIEEKFKKFGSIISFLVSIVSFIEDDYENIKTCYDYQSIHKRFELFNNEMHEYSRLKRKREDEDIYST